MWEILENFKGFKKATLTLGNFTLLVGANGSGKSSIRDALRFLHGISRGGDIRFLRSWVNSLVLTKEGTVMGGNEFGVEFAVARMEEAAKYGFDRPFYEVEYEFSLMRS